MAFDVNDPQLRAYIQQVLREGQMGGDGRSPIRERQLHDLRLLPKADDPRPMFIWSAETPRDYVPRPGTAFPKLMWHVESGEEITVQNEAEGRVKSDLYTYTPPLMSAPLDALTELQQVFESLSPEEQQMVLDAQNDRRRKEIEDKLSKLSPAALEALLAKSEVVTKRKPGRPRKDAIAS